MHEYYASNKDKFKKGLDQFMTLVVPELEKLSGKKYSEVFEEIWDHYEKELLERFPYVGGDKVSGTRNLTGAYYFVAMGEVLKRYGASMDDIGHTMVYCYERYTRKLPGIDKFVMGKFYKSPKLLNKAMLKKDAENEKNAAANPGSFETKTQIPPENGYDFSYHNLVCPLADFAKKYIYYSADETLALLGRDIEAAYSAAGAELHISYTPGMMHCFSAYPAFPESRKVCDEWIAAINSI